MAEKRVEIKVRIASRCRDLLDGQARRKGCARETHVRQELYKLTEYTPEDIDANPD